MVRKTQSNITVYDVTDGTAPLFVTNSNPTHAWAADVDGVVLANEVSSFLTTIQVYRGTDIVVPSGAASDATMANNSFRISGDAANASGITVTGSGWPVNTSWLRFINSTDNTYNVVAPSTAVDASSADSGSIDIAVRVKDGSGNIDVLTLMSYITKSIPGTGGNIIYLNSNRNTFTAGSDGVLDTGQDAVIVNIAKVGSPGAYIYETSTNGTSWATITNASSVVGGITGFNIDGSNSFTQTGAINTSATTLQITSANLSESSDNYRLRVRGPAGGSDELQIYKLRAGTPAAYDILLVLESDNMLHFSSSNQVEKKITATVYDTSDGSQITTNVGYAWYKSDNETDPVNVNNPTDNQVVSSGVNATGSFIVVGPEDVANSQQYTCVVTVT